MIESIFKKLWNFKYECNARAWKCEMVNKRIAKFVYSCVDFVFAKISPLHHTFTFYYTIIHLLDSMCVRMIYITHLKNLRFYNIGSYNFNIFNILMSSKKGNLKSWFMICFVDLPYYIKRFHYKKNSCDYDDKNVWGLMN